MSQTPPVLTQPILDWYVQGSSTETRLFQDATDNGQTLFPLAAGTTNIATASFNPGSNTFGWYLDGNYSDDTRTPWVADGHHVGFIPSADQQGNLIPNTWLVALDYGSVTFRDCDFQDLVFLVSNMRPSTSLPRRPMLSLRQHQLEPSSSRHQSAEPSAAIRSTAALHPPAHLRC